MIRRMLITGNWKMHGVRATLAELPAITAAAHEAIAEVAICPPFTLLDAVLQAAGSAVAVGGQDCHHGGMGPHTGCVAAAMLADLGAGYVIVGHSERRFEQRETDANIRSKVDAAHGAGLVPIICVGETEEHRLEGETLRVIAHQLAVAVPRNAVAADLVIAYEPVWAIGSGRTPTCRQIGEIHAFLREKLIALLDKEGESVRILYGGSVRAANAAEILAVPEVDGALVGGASLTAAEFVPIIQAAG